MTLLKSQTKVYRYIRNFLWDRDTYLIDLCRGKKVLHIGPSDWPNTEEKYKDGTLLHTKLMSVSQEILGIDNSDAGIEILAKSGIHNIINTDMNELVGIDFVPDIIIFGETIEHVMNMKVIFDGLKKIMGKDTKLIISTPSNNYSVVTALGLLGVEFVHYDHNVLFSIGTLSQLLEKNGLTVEKYYFTFISRKSNGLLFRSLHFLSKILAYILPWKAETLVFLTHIKDEQ